ncbi:multiprotein bridging factor aMBF1 [Vulcanisaeta distributa]|uniref:Transcriptional regulator, XRE family n=1 Tax=Vulcanisaeta distributa (strain DSM 14429 / JCM 11212 / NBRC 100878 / IC-017) TaxID=572478 RepID=E1QRR6_VULDI|nr:multiprotein bridging factor aMBF1 [Vulcanisaeta distributa]ADN49441.1 transcriptional regulator, XRE family [Vulcanisaeta distributa DSM 14429]
MVLTCDVCGALIEGEPVIVEIDGAVLTLCQRCARKYTNVKGVKVIRGPSQVQATQQPVSVIKYESRRGVTYRVSKPRVNVDKYEVVENYAELIREARESLGMSRDVLAKVIGVKESILRRIEDGQLIPDVELARKLEKALGISLLREAEDVGYETQKPVSKSLTLGDVVTLRERSRNK